MNREQIIDLQMRRLEAQRAMGKAAAQPIVDLDYIRDLKVIIDSPFIEDPQDAA